VKAIARVVSFVALVCTIAPAVLFFKGQLDLEATKWWMLVATIAWFAATPIWMDR
jgi:hypothetical protein